MADARQEQQLAEQLERQNAELRAQLQQRKRESALFSAHTFSHIRCSSDTEFGREFETLRPLGEGQHGKVLLVRHKESGVRCALKQIKQKSVGGSSARFKRLSVEHVDLKCEVEVEVLRRLSHPNVTRLYAAWYAAAAEGGTLNILMEYANGGSLLNLLKNASAPLDEEVVLDLLVQIAGAVNEMHSHDILHRDLKPANIFVTSRGHVKVGDFGIAKVLSDGDSLAASLIGSPYYLPPELTEGKKYGRSADVWALGVVLYEMLTTRRPFEGKSLLELARKIQGTSYEELPKTVSAELRGLVGSMLQYEPSKRPTLPEIVQLPFIRKHREQFYAELRAFADSGSAAAAGGAPTARASVSSSASESSTPSLGCVSEAVEACSHVWARIGVPADEREHALCTLQRALQPALDAAVEWWCKYEAELSERLPLLETEMSERAALLELAGSARLAPAGGAAAQQLHRRYQWLTRTVDELRTLCLERGVRRQVLSEELRALEQWVGTEAVAIQPREDEAGGLAMSTLQWLEAAVADAEAVQEQRIRTALELCRQIEELRAELQDGECGASRIAKSPWALLDEPPASDELEAELAAVRKRHERQMLTVEIGELMNKRTRLLDLGKTLPEQLKTALSDRSRGSTQERERLLRLQQEIHNDLMRLHLQIPQRALLLQEAGDDTGYAESVIRKIELEETFAPRTPSARSRASSASQQYGGSGIRVGTPRGSAGAAKAAAERTEAAAAPNPDRVLRPLQTVPSAAAPSPSKAPAPIKFSPTPVLSSPPAPSPPPSPPPLSPPPS